MTWNIEGVRRNIFNLVELCFQYKPDFILIAEPQVYKCDIDLTMSYLKGHYSFYLNSMDIFDPELPILKTKAHGGTLVLWKKQFDTFITILPAPSSAVLPFLFHPPNYAPTIHICIYLPTHGQDAEFIEEFTNLS